MVGSRAAREDFTEKAKLQTMSVLGGKSVFGRKNAKCKGTVAEACLAHLEQQGSLYFP